MGFYKVKICLSRSLFFRVEKGLEKVYGKGMFGFSRKRFLITLGASVVVWLVSGIIQLVTQPDKISGFFSFGGSCEITGYPIALCVSSNDNVKFILIALVNIILWFWILHFLWKWFENRRGL